MLFACLTPFRLCADRFSGKRYTFRLAPQRYFVKAYVKTQIFKERSSFSAYVRRIKFINRKRVRARIKMILPLKLVK